MSASWTAAGSAAEAAAAKKNQKYASLSTRYTFVPVAFETLGPVNESGAVFINEIAQRTKSITSDQRERQFLWQRLSVALQRYNAICFRGTFGSTAFQDT